MVFKEISAVSHGGTRKDLLATLTTVVLLVIGNLGMRKLLHTAAGDLLTLITRGYESASTLLTFSLSVDQGELFRDTAEVTGLVDRLLQRAHVLKAGPRSRRTQVHTDLCGEELKR